MTSELLKLICTKCGKDRHEWNLIGEESGMDFPEGIDSCLENLTFVEQFWYDIYECTRCARTKKVRRY